MTMQLIETKTLGTAAASIEFTSIPQDGTDLILLSSLRGGFSGTAQDFGFRFNGDSTSGRYTRRQLTGNGSSAASSSFSTTQGLLGAFSAATSTANTFGNGLLYIPKYTEAVQKSSSVDAVGENNATAANQALVANLYNQTTAITSILIFTVNGDNILAGSTASLYKVTKGSGGATVS